MSGGIIAALALVATVSIICGTVIVCVVTTHVHHERMREGDREEEQALAQIAATVARTAAPVGKRGIHHLPPSAG